MTACGVNQSGIGSILGIDEKTLAKHFREELDTALDRANTIIGETAFTKAKDGDVAMIRYWLNCRAKWRETPALDINEAGEGINITINFTKAIEHEPKFIGGKVIDADTQG